MKLEQRVNFPIVLDLTPFCFGGGHHTDSIGIARAAVASSLSQLPGWVSKVSPGENTLSSSSPAANSPPLGKALLQQPQPRQVAKQALVGGSVEGAGGGAPDGSGKALSGLANGAHGTRPGGFSNGAILGSDRSDESMSGQEGVEYHLKAVIVHHGGSDSGHYTAFRKLERNEAGQSSAGDGKDWVDISDETVRRASEREVLASQAYMLFYRQLEKGYYPGLG